jgi:hypothetical protein
MSEIVINNTASPKVLRDHLKDAIDLHPGKPVELSDEQIAGINSTVAGAAHLAECIRKAIVAEVAESKPGVEVAEVAKVEPKFESRGSRK